MANPSQASQVASGAVLEPKTLTVTPNVYCPGSLSLFLSQNIHKELEEKIARFHNREDAILYASCFDANAGLFEAMLDKNDALFSDQLNHASIIDGTKLCKAQTYKYKSTGKSVITLHHPIYMSSSPPSYPTSLPFYSFHALHPPFFYPLLSFPASPLLRFLPLFLRPLSPSLPLIRGSEV